MKVRLLTGRCTDDGREAHSPGDELDVDQDEAKRLLESGQAEPVGRKTVDRAERRPKEATAERR